MCVWYFHWRTNKPKLLLFMCSNQFPLSEMIKQCTTNWIKIHAFDKFFCEINFNVKRIKVSANFEKESPFSYNKSVLQEASPPRILFDLRRNISNIAGVLGYLKIYDAYLIGGLNDTSYSFKSGYQFPEYGSWVFPRWRIIKIFYERPYSTTLF